MTATHVPLLMLLLAAACEASPASPLHQLPLEPVPAGSPLPMRPPANWTVGAGAPQCGYSAYKQCDKRWANTHLGTSSNTICSAGCAMSSLAMYLTTRGHSLDPGQLNEWLKGHGGYAQGDLLVWGSVDSMGVSFQGIETGVAVSVLESGISSCHGIIANVRGGSHWVLLTGYAGNDNFYVHDPGFDQSSYPHSQMLRFAVYH